MARYPSWTRHEDAAFLARLQRAGAKIRLLDRPDLYVYVFHGRNTFPPEHFAGFLRDPGSVSLTPEEAAKVFGRLRMTTAEEIWNRARRSGL